jgi:hypothetical protein
VYAAEQLWCGHDSLSWRSFGDTLVTGTTYAVRIFA